MVGDEKAQVSSLALDYAMSHLRTATARTTADICDVIHVVMRTSAVRIIIDPSVVTFFLFFFNEQHFVSSGFGFGRGCGFTLAPRLCGYAGRRTSRQSNDRGINSEKEMR